jgi:hypothetical protein
MKMSTISRKNLEEGRAADPAKHAAVLKAAVRIDVQGTAHFDLDSPEWAEYLRQYPSKLVKASPAVIAKKRRWAKVLASWSAAFSYGRALGSSTTLKGVKTRRVAPERRALRVLSCFGDQAGGVARCPSLAFSPNNQFHYCNDCECGEREEARLSGIGSTDERPILDGNEYLKLDFPELECPRKRPGFSNEKILTLEERRELEREKYLTLRTTMPSYGSTNHGAGAKQIVLELHPTFVVDFGCGGNEFIRELRRLGVDGIGIDWANEQADVVAPMHAATPVQSGLADVVTCFDALEHLLPEDVELVLAEMRRVARPGAAFCFSIATRESQIKVNGQGLHPTVRPRQWWVQRILNVASAVEDRGGYLVGVFRE